MKRGQYNKTYPNHFDFGASLRKNYGESSYNRVFRQYKAAVIRRKLIFELTTEQFALLTKQICFYCGDIPKHKMQMKDANGPYIYNGIDRIDNNIGYTIENCVSCCKICNRAKGNLSLIEWINWINNLIAYRTEHHSK